MSNFQDLSEELILKILSYSKTKALLNCGQVSKSIRRITHDRSLWVTVILDTKIVKTELLEMILSKGCKTLVLINCTILGSLSSNMKSQLQVLYFYQNAWKGPLAYCANSIDVFEELLSSCCSLQHLTMKNLQLTPKMVDSIGKNGKTLQILNLDYSFIDKSGYLREIIKSCQELKELHLVFVERSYSERLLDEDLEFLAENIPPNVEELNLSGLDIKDDHVEILLRRCNKIEVLSLEATLITDYSLTIIKRYLNLTLEELSLAHFGEFGVISFTGFLELKSMPRLEILNLSDEEEETEKLRLHLPHLMINVFKEGDIASFYR